MRADTAGGWSTIQPTRLGWYYMAWRASFTPRERAAGAPDDGWNIQLCQVYRGRDGGHYLDIPGHLCAGGRVFYWHRAALPELPSGAELDRRLSEKDKDRREAEEEAT